MVHQPIKTLLLLSLLLITCQLLLTCVEAKPRSSGTVVNLATNSINIFRNAERWVAGFKNLTGIEVNVRSVDVSLMFEGIKTDLKSGSPFYDGFLVSPTWISDLVDCQTYGCASPWLEDLTDRVRESKLLEWDDVNNFFRLAGALYSGKVYIVPFDGDIIFNYIRTDLLNSSDSFPRTLDDLLEFAKLYHGRDLDGDGSPDYGACFSLTGKEHASVMFLSFLSPYIQYLGTQTGAFLDPTTLKPLLDNPATRVAAEKYKELAINYGPPNPLSTTLVDARDLFLKGRCAFNVDWQDIAILSNSSAFRDKIFPIRSVGSRVVWDRSTQSLLSCSSTTSTPSPACPYAQNGINYAPYAASGGWSGAISSLIPEARKEALFQFFSFMGSPARSDIDVTSGDGFEPYRKSQMTSAFFSKYSFPEKVAKSYPEELSALLNSPNAVLDLRFKNDQFLGIVTDKLTRFLAGNLTAEQMLSGIDQSWSDLMESSGKERMLSIYRKSLGLPPLVYSQEVEISVGARATIIALSVVCIVICLIFISLFVINNPKPVIKAASPIFCQMVNLGALMMFIAMVLYSVSVSDGVCMSIPWLLNTGYTILFASLVAKNYRIVKIFQRKNPLKVTRLPLKKLFSAVGFFLTLNFVVLICWAIIDPIKAKNSTDGVGANQFIQICDSEHFTIWIATLVLLDAGLLLLGCFLAFQTKDIYVREFNESRMIAYSTYNFAIIAVIIVPVVVLIKDPTPKFIIVGLGILLAALGCICFMFIPKFYTLFAGEKSNIDLTEMSTQKQTSTVTRNSSNSGGVCVKCGAHLKCNSCVSTICSNNSSHNV